MSSFRDLAELNAWLEVQCIAQWGEIQHGVMPGTVADVQAEEVSCLMPLGWPSDGFVEQIKRVSPTCLIAFDRNRYSVPASFANRRVSLRVYPDRLVIAAEGQIVCKYARLIDRSHHKPGRTIYDWRHNLAVIQRVARRLAQFALTVQWLNAAVNKGLARCALLFMYSTR